ncbi:sodium-anion symporter [Litorilinea aerophila]|uniref:Sodium-dependent dicarboxylate transporter SdcS n=2 Tax=Litorilinea aerophila TaxID=1204385 RepID=A0A540VF93_9CHLR|nr:sodium-anion symporter [Litorilinea aerophila]
MTLKRSRLKSSLPPTATLRPPPSHRQIRQEGPPGPAPESSPAAASDGGGRRGDTAERTMTSKRRLQRRVTPLQVLQEPLQAGVRKVFDLRRFLLVLGLTTAVLLFPTPEGLSPEGHRGLALFIFTGSILALEPAPLPIAALMVPICQIALGIDQAPGAFAPFGQPVVFLILGSLFLAEALRKHGLTRRLALYAIVASKGNFRLLLLELMLITGALSMWVLNTATAAVLIPVAITIAQRVPRQEEARRVLTLLILGIAYSSSIGAIATIMGSGENAIAVGLLDEVMDFGFLDWMQFGLPISVTLIPLSWAILLRTLPAPSVRIDTEPAAKELTRLGSLKGPEREILAILFVSVVLWVSGSSLESMLHLPRTLLSSAVVAIGAVALLSIDEVIDWNDLKGVNWGVFFVIGAGLTLGDALDKTGASAWFAAQLAPALEGLPYGVILVILVMLGFSLTQFMNNVTLGAILAPVLITLAQASGISPPRLLLPTIISLALAYMLPSASARMTLVAVTGAVERKDMIRAGLAVGLPSALVVIAFFYGLSVVGWI